MSDIEDRLRETEALNLLTNRILMDFLSLQIDAGQASLSGVKQLIAFSAAEAIKGGTALKPEIEFFERALSDRFEETFKSKAAE